MKITLLIAAFLLSLQAYGLELTEVEKGENLQYQFTNLNKKASSPFLMDIIYDLLSVNSPAPVFSLKTKHIKLEINRSQATIEIPSPSLVAVWNGNHPINPTDINLIFDGKPAKDLLSFLSNDLNLPEVGNKLEGGFDNERRLLSNGVKGDFSIVCYLHYDSPTCSVGRRKCLWMSEIDGCLN